MTLAKFASSFTTARPRASLALPKSPEIRTLHAIERASRSVGERHHSALQIIRVDVASDSDIAKEGAGRGCGVARHADDADAIGGIADHACIRPRCANHAMYSA